MSDGSLNFDTKVDKEGFNNGVNDIRRNFEKAQKQMTAELEKTQGSMRKTITEINKVSASLDVMYQSAKGMYDGLPNNQKLIDAELAKNSEYQKSIQKAEELNAQYTAQEKECQILKDNINALTEKKRQLNDEDNKSKVVIPQTTNNMEGQAKEANTLEKAVKRLIRRFKLLIIAMIIRGAINAVKDGFNDLAKYSEDFNGTMSELQGTFLQARNSIATAFAPILQSLTPIITTVTNAIIELMNAIAQVNAVIFKNSTTFTKAKKVTTDYAKSLGGAGKEAKKSLASFDEINQLTNKDTGGSSNGVPVANEMFEEVEVNPEILEIAGKLQPIIDTLKALEPISFDNLVKSLENLKTALDPFTFTLFDGINWAIDNIFHPLTKWVVEDALPKFFELLGSVLNVLNSILEVFKPLGLWLWENFLKPVGVWTGDLIISALETLTDLLNKFADWISNNKQLVEDLAIVIGTVTGAFTLFNVAMNAANIATGIWNAIGAIAAGVTTAFGAAVAFLTSPITLVILAIGLVVAAIILLIKNWDAVMAAGELAWEGIKKVWNCVATWFKETIIQPIVNFFVGMWDNIKNGASNAWQGIKDVFSGITTWFKDKFTEAWTAVKNVFSTGGKIFDGIKEGIANVFKTVVNGIIGGINKVISVPFNAINGMLNKIRNATFLGITPFQNFWGQNPLPVPQIPKLATGTVVPANYGNFLATLGDNKREPEVVSPLSTIEQAVSNVMNKNPNNLEITIYHKYEDGRTIIQKINKAQFDAGKVLLYT